jgi:hypothetical protein
MTTKNAVILIGQIEAVRSQGKNACESPSMPAVPVSARLCSPLYPPFSDRSDGVLGANGLRSWEAYWSRRF